MSKRRAVYSERGKYGSGASIRKPAGAMQQGAGCLAYFLVIACGYLFMVLAGQWGEERGYHRGMMANTVKRRTLGLWRVGREIINNPDKYWTRPEALMSKVSKVILVA